MRAALPLALLLCTAGYVPAQAPHPLGGTWYAGRDAGVALRAGSDAAAPLAVTALVTLELRVDGTAVTGEERHALSIPAEETTNRKDPLTISTVRTVTGTVAGGTVRLTMTAATGPALVYEGTLSPDGHRLTLRLVPEADVRGDAATPPPVTFGRQAPKPRVVK